MAAFATFPTLIPVFRREWDLTSTEAGWVSGVYFAGYVAAVAVLTALTDRVPAKRVYLLGMAISFVGALGFAVGASGMWSASLWRLLQGIGLAGTYMPGLKALTDVVPARLQSRAVAFYTASFGIGASFSYFVSGQVGAGFGWQAAFAVCALGPLVAFFAAAILLPASPPRWSGTRTRLLDFRPVLANRSALGFTLAYTAHNAELFAFRSWIVAFLTFSQTQQAHQLGGGTAGLLWSAATLAALINLVGLPSSVLTNELAARHGRRPTITTVMTLSAIVGAGFGFIAASPFWVVVAVAFLFGVTIAADSATITAGVVQVADPRYRGTTMAMHSVVGFVGAFAGPLLFGLVLDLAGGAESIRAWGLAFATMAVLLVGGMMALRKLVTRER